MWLKELLAELKIIEKTFDVTKHHLYCNYLFTFNNHHNKCPSRDSLGIMKYHHFEKRSEEKPQNVLNERRSSYTVKEQVFA